MFGVRKLRNTQIHCAGKMLRFLMLKQMVRTITSGIAEVKQTDLLTCSNHKTGLAIYARPFDMLVWPLCVKQPAALNNVS